MQAHMHARTARGVGRQRQRDRKTETNGKTETDRQRQSIYLQSHATVQKGGEEVNII